VLYPLSYGRNTVRNCLVYVRTSQSTTAAAGQWVTGAAPPRSAGRATRHEVRNRPRHRRGHQRQGNGLFLTGCPCLNSCDRGKNPEADKVTVTGWSVGFSQNQP